MAKTTQAAEPSTEMALANATPEQIEMAYRAILDGDVLPEFSDPEAVSRAIMERVRKADSFEEAFAPQSIPAWSNYLDEPVKVRDLHFNRSTIKGGTGPQLYAVVKIVKMDTGEALTVSCGGRNVLVQLVKLVEKGWLDRAVKLTAKQTASDFDVLWLEPA